MKLAQTSRAKLWNALLSPCLMTHRKTPSKLAKAAAGHAVAPAIARTNPTTAGAVIIFHSTNELSLNLTVLRPNE